ncbi:hypothetical protein [Kitasatospora sp. NPDC050543]|uniref:hypothetical protein n=1 Tax=Kitasatospora sp. NPDC050543 TaxID=3364054 RepID=UPI0037994723
MGGWAGGTPYDPAGAQPAALRWTTGADWRPALRAIVAPTAVLLLAALVTAVPTSYGGEFAAPFGIRYGAALAAALAALGAPFEAVLAGGVRSGANAEYSLRVVPMTVTVLWLLALWLGLRAGLNRRQAAHGGGQLTRQQACGEAARTALVAAAVTLLLGLLGGGDWRPPVRGRGTPVDYGDYDRLLSVFGVGVDAGWLQSAGWAFLLAGLLALTVYGTDALRWAAWRSRAVRGWAVAALTAGRVLAVTVGLAALTAFVIVAAQGEANLTVAALAFLPNLGLLLLGYGSGATFAAGDGSSYRSPYAGSGSRFEAGEDNLAHLSLFDMQGLTADWRWAALLAVAGALFLGWTAHRRQLDSADRLRLAAVYAGALSLLMLIAGAALSSTLRYREHSDYFPDSVSRGPGAGGHTSLGLLALSVLLANAVWAAAGALGVPLLFGRGSRPATTGAGFEGAPPTPGTQAPASPLGSVPTQGGPGDLTAPDAVPGAVPDVAPPAVAAPTDLLDSHGDESGAAEDPSVWRK